MWKYFLSNCRKKYQSKVKQDLQYLQNENVDLKFSANASEKVTHALQKTKQRIN